MMFSLLLILCLGLPAFLGANSCIDASIGASAILPCKTPADMKKEEFLWLLNGTKLGDCQSGKWKADDSRYFVSIEQEDFSLRINPVREEDRGTYECRINFRTIQSTCLYVKEGQTQTATVTPTKGVSTSRQNPTVQGPIISESPSPGVIVVIVLVVLVVVAVGAAVLIKLWRKQQMDENLTDCISFFHACGKEGKKKRGENVSDSGPFEAPLVL